MSFITISPIGNQDYNLLFNPLPMISANHFSPLSFSNPS